MTYDNCKTELIIDGLSAKKIHFSDMSVIQMLVIPILPLIGVSTNDSEILKLKLNKWTIFVEATKQASLIYSYILLQTVKSLFSLIKTIKKFAAYKSTCLKASVQKRN